MNPLFVRVDELEPADRKVVEVFLRFAGRTAHVRWQVAADGLVHLRLRDERERDEADTVSLALDDTPAAPAAPIVWIAAPGKMARGAESLARPLQIEEFTAMLRAREVEIDPGYALAAAGSAPPPAPPAAPRPPVAPTAPVRAVAPTLAPPTPVVRIATPEPAAPSPSGRFTNDRRYVYRLRKWPGSDLLRGHPKYVRMLGFLSHRPLSVARLMLLSGVDEAACLELLDQLDRRQLLVRMDVEPDTVPMQSGEPSAFLPEPVRGESPAAAPAPAPLPAAARPREAANGGLFARLRKRLGLA